MRIVMQSDIVSVHHPTRVIISFVSSVMSGPSVSLGVFDRLRLCHAASSVLTPRRRGGEGKLVRWQCSIAAVKLMEVTDIGNSD